MDRYVHYNISRDAVEFRLAGETSEWVEAAVTGEALEDAYGSGPGEAARLQTFAEHERHIRDVAEQLLGEGLEPLVRAEDLAARRPL